MGQLYNKFLKLKPDVNWTYSTVPLEYFTQDAALMVTDIGIHNIIEEYDLHCEIFINPGKYFTGTTSAFAYQKDFPLKEVIDYHLLKFQQSGLLEQLAKKYFKTQILHDCQPPVRELDFKATSLSFAFLTAGVMIALMVSFVEKIRAYLQNKLKKKENGNGSVPTFHEINSYSK